MIVVNHFYHQVIVFVYLNERSKNNNHLIGKLPKVTTSHDSFQSPNITQHPRNMNQCMANPRQPIQKGSRSCFFWLRDPLRGLRHVVRGIHCWKGRGDHLGRPTIINMIIIVIIIIIIIIITISQILSKVCLLHVAGRRAHHSSNSKLTLSK